MWNDNEIAYLKNNYGYKTLTELAHELQKSERTITRKAKELGLTTENKKWEFEELLILKQYYEKTDIYDLLKLLPNRSMNAIMLKANKLGLKKEVKNRDFTRKYYCDFEYFKNIDTPNKAYYLGWAFTDGNISGNQYRLRVHKKDKEILEMFSKELRSTYPIYERDSYVELDITSEIFVKHLIRHGCTSRKTYNLRFPNISEDFLFDFIKGIFDGDGSYVFTEKTKKITLISASSSFVYFLQSVLIDNAIITYVTHTGNYYILSIERKDSIKKFVEKILYTHSDFLHRKKEKMIKLLEYVS